eukprot:2885052-Lingulodinium_polyedra.AAC.2
MASAVGPRISESRSAALAGAYGACSRPMSPRAATLWAAKPQAQHHPYCPTFELLGIQQQKHGWNTSNPSKIDAK